MVEDGRSHRKHCPLRSRLLDLDLLFSLGWGMAPSSQLLAPGHLLSTDGTKHWPDMCLVSPGRGAGKAAECTQ